MDHDRLVTAITNIVGVLGSLVRQVKDQEEFNELDDGLLELHTAALRLQDHMTDVRDRISKRTSLEGVEVGNY